MVFSRGRCLDPIHPEPTPSRSKRTNSSSSRPTAAIAESHVHRGRTVLVKLVYPQSVSRVTQAWVKGLSPEDFPEPVTHVPSGEVRSAGSKVNAPGVWNIVR